jgi:phosphate transport system protein
MTEVRRTFHEELTQLRDELLEMGSLADAMVDEAVRALFERDKPLAASVVAQDARLDSLNRDVEQRCLWMIATQQPNTRDLRTISAGFRMTTDLERIGDHAVDIAKISQKIADGIPVQKEIGELARLAQQQLKLSVGALSKYEAATISQILTEDVAIEDAFYETRERLLDSAPDTDAQGGTSNASGYLLLIVVSLERIAHHAAHIAERLNFIETGHLEIPRDGA